MGRSTACFVACLLRCVRSTRQRPDKAKVHSLVRAACLEACPRARWVQRKPRRSVRVPGIGAAVFRAHLSVATWAGTHFGEFWPVFGRRCRGSGGRLWRLLPRRSVRKARSYLVDPASSHMLVSKTKPCMSKYKPLYGETANGSLNQLWFLRS